jgi:hypothetical protein
MTNFLRQLMGEEFSLPCPLDTLFWPDALLGPGSPQPSFFRC